MSTPRFMLRAAVMLGRSLLSCDPAPHTLRYIHGFARIEIAQERRCFVVPLISRRAISNQILLILLILSKTSTRSTCSTRLNINHLLFRVFRVFRGSDLSAYSATLRLCVKHQTSNFYTAPILTFTLTSSLCTFYTASIFTLTFTSYPHTHPPQSKSLHRQSPCTRSSTRQTARKAHIEPHPTSPQEACASSGF